MSDQPHSSWVDVYDLAYEHSFGEFYNQLTAVTIQVIAERINPPAKIVDFGAGTGRLSIPLAEQGFCEQRGRSCFIDLEEAGSGSG